MKKQIVVTLNDVDPETHKWVKGLAKEQGRTLPRQVMHLVKMVKAARESGAGCAIDELPQFQPSAKTAKNLRATKRAR